MALFVIETNEDGSTSRILKDGQPHVGAVTLEQWNSIVKIYFDLAQQNLLQIEEGMPNEVRRKLGLQSFIMSLTGLEAFTNTYFRIRADELHNEQMLARINQTHGSLSRKIEELIHLSGDGPIENQANLIDRIYRMSQLRNDVLHPRWAPSSVILDGQIPIVIHGMAENPQKIFEDQQFCRESLYWCLSLIARVSRTDDIEGFMFHWTGNYGLTLAMIDAVLGCEELNSQS
jgi:hypothetical protein